VADYQGERLSMLRPITDESRLADMPQHIFRQQDPRVGGSSPRYSAFPHAPGKIAQRRYDAAGCSPPGDE
jgi:hypothetical protein